MQERGDHAEIARQVIESGVDIIFGGGEAALLPAGVAGRHGEGARPDNLNLIERARELGYAVVYTRDELLALPRNTARVLGVFAHAHTFNADTEEALRAAGLPLFVPTAPTIAEMAQVALELLANNPKTTERGFFMVAEEEATDNFPNSSHAAGSFEAGRRADEAFGLFREFISRSPRTLLLTAADSSAGSKNVMGASPEVTAALVSEPVDVQREVNTGADGQWALAPLDGVDGAGTAPFISAPDRNGNTLGFGVVWATEGDVASGILARAEGLNAERVSALGVVDNTDIYRLMYLTLFDRWLE